MAYSAIDKSSLNFNVLKWAGNDSNRTLTGVGFQPDAVWIKPLNLAYSWTVADAVRGATGNGTYSGTVLLNSSNAPEGDTNDNGAITAFTSDGYTLTDGTSDFGRVNGSYNYVSWNWKGNGAGSANTDGSLDSTVSVNTNAGFSIVKWHNNTGSVQTIGHGLGKVPKFIVMKVLSSTGSWNTYHDKIGNTHGLYINSDAGDENNDAFWNDTSPTSTVFTTGTNGNLVNNHLVAYCFADVEGYQKIGEYKGNGLTDGQFIYTGFKPSLIIIKRSDTTKNWYAHDYKRAGYNPQNDYLSTNLSAVEGSYTEFDIYSNGFKLRGSGTGHNTSGAKYVYYAVGQSLVGSNDVPCTAR